MFDKSKIHPNAVILRIFCNYAICFDNELVLLKSDVKIKKSNVLLAVCR
jgi:hypothetical protein